MDKSRTIGEWERMVSGRLYSINWYYAGIRC